MSSFPDHPLRRKKIFFQKKFLLKNGLLLFLILLLGSSLGILGIFVYFGKDLPDPNTLSTRSINQSTKIYDRTGTHLLYEIHGQKNRTLVKIAQSFCYPTSSMEHDPNGIPLVAIQATITAEDRSFCTHHGFSIKGTMRAVLANLQGSRQGGSTLTQQLIGNALVGREKRLSRKIKELILSIEIERRYSKDEILQIYFNEIPYGSTNYGIQAAAQNYFHKDIKDLNLAEHATIAAIPQRPTTFLNNPDLLKSRRDWILDGMTELGFISKDQATQAKQEITVIQPQVANITAPHFVFYVKQQLEDQYGQQQVEEGGLKVITTLDIEKEILAEEIVKKGVEAKGKQYGFENAALVAIDPRTGQILSMVGSKGYFDTDIDGQVNIAVRRNQPGSSFKPIVYAAGFMKGYTPNTIFWDVKTDFPTTPVYSPKNYDGKQRGPVTVRTALQGSLNIPAVKMAYLVGVNPLLDFAQSLGYTTFSDRSRFGLAVSLGGGEVTLLDHANAFAAFADNGVYHTPTSILRVEDSKGTVLHEWKDGGKKVMEPNISAMVSNVLSDNNARSYIFGSNSNLQLGNRPVAAKSGTTNDAKTDAPRDAWLMGYTPSLAVGVWTGNNDDHPMSQQADGSNIAGPIWNEFMRRALDKTPIESFPPITIPITGKAILDGTIPTATVTIDRASGKLATDLTPPSYREEKTFTQYHSILHFVQKDNPWGDPPTQPIQDPYYPSWEEGITRWIQAQELTNGTPIEQGNPPTEYDDVHIPENTPAITIQSPDENEKIDSRSLTISVNTSAPRGISRVEFYLDGYYLGTENTPPYRFYGSIPAAMKQGYHSVKAIAYDDIDNTSSALVGIQLTTDGTAEELTIVDPKNDQSIERTSDTYTVVATVYNVSEFTSVHVYTKQVGSTYQTLIGTFNFPSSPFLATSWALPQTGDWILYARGEKQNGISVDTAGIVVHILPNPTPATNTNTSTTTTTSSPSETNTTSSSTSALLDELFP